VPRRARRPPYDFRSSRNGWIDAASTGSGFFVPSKGITMNWQGSSSRGREEAGYKRDSAAGTANRT